MKWEKVEDLMFDYKIINIGLELLPNKYKIS
jgi:hypothetical protein